VKILMKKIVPNFESLTKVSLLTISYPEHRIKQNNTIVKLRNQKPQENSEQVNELLE
jgi:hypothetical protein